jgi:uncharacterized membrane protein YuzA (DUF378 family)
MEDDGADIGNGTLIFLKVVTVVITLGALNWGLLGAFH